MKIDVNDYIVDDNQLKDLGLDKMFEVPVIGPDDSLTGVSDYDDGMDSLDEVLDVPAGYYESSSFDSEDYDTFNDPLA